MNSCYSSAAAATLIASTQKRLGNLLFPGLAQNANIPPLCQFVESVCEWDCLTEWE